ncbi:MAG: site-specific DNA-methyltransferase [Anaerolineae bacterium]
MTKNPKLELTWIGKENRPQLEPRILLEDPEKSYHASHRVTDQDSFDNRLIFGDNLLALKALEQEYAGKIKCIYIDPPFNTQQAFEHYDDTVEHSIWLSLMRDRLELLRRLLARDGTLFVHIDDNELGYLIVLLDELFGRDNRLYVVTFKQASATGHKAINPGCVNTTNFLLIYAKEKSHWTPNRVFTGRERDERYSQFIENVEEPYRFWRITTLVKAFAEAHHILEGEAREIARTKPGLLNEFVTTQARSVMQFARPNYEGVSAEARKLIDISKSKPEEIFCLQRKGYSDIYLRGGRRILFYADKLKEIDGQMVAGEPLTTLWQDILSNNIHAEGGVVFPKGKKPEGLIKRVLDLTTNPGDWVLDSFAGSGTTGAVAHKMGRRWIMIELGEHCHTHIIPRLRKVIDSEDKGGVTQAVGWQGGGGFRYFRLAPSLLEKDRWGNWVINKQYNAAMLAEALCKLEGFTYAPSDAVYWQHGHSTESDFIYVTTQTLSPEQLAQLSDEVGPERSLLALCLAFRGAADRYPNLTVKKIPKTVLAACEWGHDDYSLKVENLPSAPPKPARPATPNQPSLFGVGE